MSAPKKRSFTLALIGAAVLAFFAGLVVQHGMVSIARVPGWTTEAIRLKMLTPQQDASRGYYERSAGTPLPLATIVRELHAAWPNESVGVVHQSALQVATGLLHRGDIEIGEMVGGRFVPSNEPRWDINARMIENVTAEPTFFANERIYVFRRK